MRYPRDSRIKQREKAAKRYAAVYRLAEQIGKSAAARVLGISPSTLGALCRKHEKWLEFLRTRGEK